MGFLVSASLKANFLLNHLWLTWLILDHLWIFGLCLFHLLLSIRIVELFRKTNELPWLTVIKILILSVAIKLISMDLLIPIIALIVLANQWHRAWRHCLLWLPLLSWHFSIFSRIIQPLRPTVEWRWNLARIWARRTWSLAHVFQVIFVWVYDAFPIFAQLGSIAILRLLRLGALSHLVVLVWILCWEPSCQCALPGVLHVPRILQALCILVLVLGPMPVDYLLVTLCSGLDRISRSWGSTSPYIRLYSYLFLSLCCLLCILNIVRIAHLFSNFGVWRERKWLLLLVLCLKCTLFTKWLIVQRAVDVIFGLVLFLRKCHSIRLFLTTWDASLVWRLRIW